MTNRTFALLALFLPLAYVCCGKATHSSGNGSVQKASPFQCEAGLKPTGRQVRRLSKNQIAQTIVAIFGPQIQPSLDGELSLVPDDQFTGNIEKFLKTFSEQHINGITSVAESVAIEVSANWTKYSLIQGSCYPSYISGQNNTCLDSIVTRLGGKFFRKPVDADTLTSLKNIFLIGTTKSESLYLLISYSLQSPHFLYLTEGLYTTPSSLANESITSYELASKLSYAITDGPPDDTIMALAESNDIFNDDIFSLQIDRLLTTSEARKKSERFLDFWVDMEKVSVTPTGPNDFVSDLNTVGLQAELVREMKEFFTHTLFTEKGNFRRLMTSNVSFARTPAAAQIYAHSALASNKLHEIVGDSDRIGIAMKAPLFFASSAETHPILRGARFRANFLCDKLPLPTPDNLLLGPDVNTEEMITNNSGRMRTHIKTSGRACIGCHSYINPVGFAFEHFDSFGRYREKEKAYSSDNELLALHTIDPQDIMPPLADGSEEIEFGSAKEFIDKVSSDVTANACFTRKMYQFYQLDLEQKADHCALDSVYKTVQSDTGSIIDGLKMMLTHKSFKAKNENQ